LTVLLRARLPRPRQRCQSRGVCCCSVRVSSRWLALVHGSAALGEPPPTSVSGEATPVASPHDLCRAVRVRRAVPPLRSLTAALRSSGKRGTPRVRRPHCERVAEQVGDLCPARGRHVSVDHNQEWRLAVALAFRRRTSLSGMSGVWHHRRDPYQWRRELGTGARLELRLTDAQRKLLNTWARAGTTPQRVARRANAVLLAADGLSARLIAKRLRISPRTAALWPRRYVQGGHETLWRDAPGRGRRPSIDAAAVSRVRTLVKTAAPDGGRWSIRRLAKATGLSRASVHRIVRGHW